MDRNAHVDALDLRLSDVAKRLEGADDELGVCEGLLVRPGEVCEAETHVELAEVARLGEDAGDDDRNIVLMGGSVGMLEK